MKVERLWQSGKSRNGTPPLPLSGVGPRGEGGLAVQCQKKKRDRVRCMASALTGKKFCALHSELGKAAELGSKGGRRRTVYSPDALKEFSAPKSAADLRDLLAQSIIEIRTGKLDPKLANSISYLGSGFLRAVEVSDLERRLAALEGRREQGDGHT
jgi:hypothetical protein